MQDDQKSEEIEPKPQDKETEAEAPEQDPEGDATGDEGRQLTDKHGEPAINLGHHRRIVAERDARIAELERQLDEERTLHSLERMGCIDTKSATYRLEEFGGDVEALKEACPHLFAPRHQAGSTGLTPRGATSGLDDKINLAFNHR